MSKTNIAIVLYDKFAPIDAFGPIQMFDLCFKPDTGENYFDVFTMGTVKGTINAGTRLSGVPVDILYSFTDDFDYDIILVPGSDSTTIKGLLADEAFMNGLTFACKKAKIIASVCTGAALVAATGLVDGMDMTTNKISYKWVAPMFPNIKWKCQPRWIDRIDPETQTGLISSAGVSAGTDMALGLISSLHGKKVAECTKEITEYNWLENPDEDTFAYLCSGERKC